MIIPLGNQVALQHLLLRDAREQEYDRMDTAGGGVPGCAVAQVGGAKTSLTQMATMPPPASAPPLTEDCSGSVEITIKPFKRS